MTRADGDGLRATLGQVSWVVRRYPPRRLAVQAGVVRSMRLPRLPHSRRRPGTVWGVAMVKDEADVVDLTALHLLAQGVDALLVADNGSSDGTRDLLADLARRHPVHVADDPDPAYHQSEKMTRLAHAAWRAGADWVLPFDADEFFFARGTTVADRLRASRATVVHADFHHMVPTVPTPRLAPETEVVMDTTPDFPGKVAARSHPLLEILPGNHGATRVGEHERGLHIAHAIYRHPGQVARKLRQGSAAVRAAGGRWVGTHWTKGAGLDDATIGEVWDRISSGHADERIDFAARGPMVRVRPLSWSTWDPDDEVGPPPGRG